MIRSIFHIEWVNTFISIVVRIEKIASMCLVNIDSPVVSLIVEMLLTVDIRETVCPTSCIHPNSLSASVVHPVNCQTNGVFTLPG